MKRVLLFILLILFFSFLAFSQEPYRRVSIRKSTGIVIEAQDKDSQVGTLIQNAKNGGILESDITEKLVTKAEYDKLRAARDAMDPPKAPSLEERIAVLEAEVAQLKAKLGKE